MTLAPGASAVDIDVCARNGRVCGVSIKAAVESAATTLFRGREARVVPGLARSLFALCPVAQGIAAACALDAAQGSVYALKRAQEIRLVAERIGENLRSIVLDWPVEAGRGGPDADAHAALRAAFAALRALAQGEAETAPEPNVHLDRVRAAAQALGLPQSPRQSPSSGWIASIWRQVENDPVLCAMSAPHPIVDEDDDLAMFDALAADERAWPQQRSRDCDFLSRLRARFSAVAESLDRLEALAIGVQNAGLLSIHAQPRGVGAVAIDSPRGRLYHHVTLDADGCVARYRIVAPTDRTFRHDGLFAHALAGAAIGEGAAAELRVARVAALFDPCVAVRICVRESADA